MKPLNKFVETHALALKNHVALSFKNMNLSYSELNEVCNKFSRWILHFFKSEKNKIVGIYLSRSIETIVTVLSCFKLNIPFLLLDVDHPAERNQRIIDECNISTIITHKKNQNNLAHFYKNERIICDVETILNNNDLNCFDIDRTPMASDLAYVIYTSGSTGFPKGVMIEHGSLSNLAESFLSFVPVTYQDKVLQLSPPSFDAFIWDLYTAFIAGAALIIEERDHLLPGMPLHETIQKHEVTVATFTPSLLNTLNPQNLSSLRMIISAGEACPPYIINKFKHLLFVNAYGATENTICASRCLSSKTEYTHDVPLGEPLAGINILLLDEEGNPVKNSEIGEIHIGGKCLARGYINNEKITSEKFIYLDNNRLYKTGDLAYYNLQNELIYVGRQDRQVKHLGYRIELDEIELALLTHKNIKNAAVIYREGKIISYIEGQANTINIHEIKQHLHYKIPGYMVPIVYISIPAIPLTHNNKKDYAKLSSLLHNDQKSLRNKNDKNNTTIGALEEIILEKISDILSIPDLNLSDSIFHTGIDSFTIAKLIHFFEHEFGVRLNITELFESNTISELAKMISNKECAQKSHKKVFSFKQEVENFPDIQINDHVDYKVKANSYDGILLTGATGFLGIHLLKDLLKCTKQNIYCLVRSSANEKDIFTKIMLAAQKYQIDLTTFQSRIIPVLGELKKSNMGLSDIDYDTLSKQINTIYHCAGNLSFIHPYSYLKPDNVNGTYELLKFSVKNRIKPFHYVSTLAVFSCRHYFETVGVITENTDTLKSEPYLQYDSGYVQSKWVADSLVQKMMNKGLPIHIYRPGFILSHSKTGAHNPTQKWSVILKACLERGNYPILREQTEAFITVDDLVKSIISLSNQKSGIYHINVSHQFDLKSADFFRKLNLLYYLDLTPLPYKEWIASLSENSNQALCLLLPFLKDTVYKDKTIPELYENMSNYSSVKTLTLLKELGIQLNPIDSSTIRNYINFAISKKVLSLENYLQKIV